jgi:cytoskeletal protein RodZ
VRGPLPTIAPDAEFSGKLLREVREALGVELREISERTKISAGYLSAIEEERFDKLPAPVYVRGFLVEYCKLLGLDVARVLETYFQRFLNGRVPEDRA